MLRICTYNIAYDARDNSRNTFDNRKPLLLAAVARQKPDILCFQEVLPHVALWLRENLHGYTLVGCGRDRDLGGEQMTVCFRTERFNLIRMDTYWLSPTPHIPGSRYEKQSICPRCATDLILRDMAENRVFRLINTHLDHESASARLNGLWELIAHVEKKEWVEEIPVILTGDFNAPPDAMEMQPIRGFFRNATRNIGITFHGYTPDTPQETIDYILLRGAVEAVAVKRWEDREGDLWLSDHYPVEAVLRWDE